MGVIKYGGRVHARGGISIGAGASGNFTDSTAVASNTTTMFIPHSTAVGTTQTVNGAFLVTQRAAGSPCLVARMGGTTYYVALTAA